jgi:FkbM family methyltransferase
MPAAQYFTVMSAVYGCRVLGFEPNIKPRAFARVSIDLNSVAHLVTLVAAGIDTHNGYGQMIHDEEWGIGAVAEASYSGGPDIKLTGIPLVPLADAVHERALLIKVDTEGHEDKVFPTRLRRSSNATAPTISWSRSRSATPRRSV